MPIYEYICDDCQAEFERIVLNQAQEITCPKCASKKNTIQLSVFSSPNGSNGSSNSASFSGAAAKSSPFSGGGGGCGGGGCGCN
jgi:putative FmdB family regulatory protein